MARLRSRACLVFFLFLFIVPRPQTHAGTNQTPAGNVKNSTRAKDSGQAALARFKINEILFGYELDQLDQDSISIDPPCGDDTLPVKLELMFDKSGVNYRPEDILRMTITPALKGHWNDRSIQETMVWSIDEPMRLNTSYTFELSIIDPKSRKLLDKKAVRFDKTNLFKWCRLDPVKMQKGRLTLQFRFNFPVNSQDLAKHIKLRIGTTDRKLTWLPPPTATTPTAELELREEEINQNLSFEIAAELKNSDGRGSLGRAVKQSLPLLPWVQKMRGPKLRIPPSLMEKAKFDAAVCKSKRTVESESDLGGDVAEITSCYYNGLSTKGDDARWQLMQQLCKKKMPLIPEFFICIEE